MKSRGLGSKACIFFFAYLTVLFAVFPFIFEIYKTKLDEFKCKSGRTFSVLLELDQNVNVGFFFYTLALHNHSSPRARIGQKLLDSQSSNVSYVLLNKQLR